MGLVIILQFFVYRNWYKKTTVACLGGGSREALRPIEDAKIRCGKKHFEALGNSVEFKEVDDFNNFIESV